MKTNLGKVSSKSDLLELQRFFAKKIRTPLLSGDLLSPDSKINQMIVSNGKTDPSGRLQFYTRQYWWRIIGSFDEDFPNVQKLLTKDQYEKLKMAYLEKYPSVSFTLRHLGARFSGFVKKNPKYTAKKTAMVYDAARFDWAKMEAYEFAHNPAISIEDVTSPRFPSKKLYLQPHVRLLKLDYPINILNRESGSQEKEVASNSGNKSKKVVSKESKLKLQLEKTFLALHRYEGKIFIKKITEVEYKVLSNFQNGYSIKNFADDVVTKFKGVGEEELQSHFNELMALGWLFLKKVK